MAQTAVEWIAEKMEKLIPPGNQIAIYIMLEQAKQMEKEQIQKAFSDGQETPINHPTIPHYSREEYYNETYNK